MRISKNGLDFIKKCEGCKLFAYRCPSGVLTIGYGSTKNVKAGMAITQQQAEQRLLDDVAPLEAYLNKMGVNFTQNEFDALISWLFNLGIGNFESSTLKKKICQNAPDIEVTGQMVRWFLSNKKPLKGLKMRRCDEANMFLGRNVYYVDSNEEIKKKA